MQSATAPLVLSLALGRTLHKVLFVMQPSTRRNICYCVASYAVGPVILAWQYHETGHLYGDPAELLFPLAMPVIWPFYFLYGTGMLTIAIFDGSQRPVGVQMLAPYLTMVATFLIVFFISSRLLRRSPATVA